MENQYNINIQVRDYKGKPYIDNSNGHNIKRLGIKFESEISGRTQAKIVLGDVWNSLKTWMPHNQVEVSASYFDRISATWSTVWSINEDGKFNVH